MTGRILSTLWIAAILALVLAVPALAGSEGKCTAGTQECLDWMAKNYKNKGWVGVELEANETSGGFTITKVVAGSPAEEAGLEIGDVLIAMNGEALPYETDDQKEKMMKVMTPGATIKYIVSRNGEKNDVAVTLAKIPEYVLAEWIGRHMLDHVDVAKK